MTFDQGYHRDVPNYEVHHEGEYYCLESCVIEPQIGRLLATGAARVWAQMGCL